MLQSIVEYQKIKASIPDLLEVSGYRNDFVAKKLGIKAATFSVKKQRGNWSDTEVAKLVEVLTSVNKEVMDFLDAQLVESRNTGNRVTSEQFKKNI